MSTTHPLTLPRLADLLLGADPRQRLRVQRSLLAGFVYAVCIALVAFGAQHGDMPRVPVLLISAYGCAGVVLFYVALRSGWNRRFADPALTVPQILYAISTLSMGYPLAGPVRGALLMLLVFVMVFGMFSLTPRQARRLSLVAVASIGCAMLAVALLAPAAYPPSVEFAHFVLVATTLPAYSVLAGQLTELRARLRSQKLELAHALARIQDLATRDELTQLFNRRHMRQLVAEHAKLARRSASVLAVGLIDIDHFKRINDGHGHGVGDEVLRGFSRQAQAALRQTDVMARWGGEEFLVLFPSSSAAEAAQGLERLRFALQQAEVSATVPQLRITFSAGLTEHGADESDEAVIERADRALYAAKSAGRDRIRIHQQTLQIAKRE